MNVLKVHLDDADVAYVADGSGVPIVFVHGAGGDWRTFDPLRPFIAEQARYISYSRRYHYPNEWTDGGEKYTIEQHAMDLGDFIKALGLPAVHLVGGSYGGRIAAWFALKHPECLRSLTLSEPALINGDSDDVKRSVSRWVADLTALFEAAKAGRLEDATRLFFDAVLDQPGAFDRWPEERRQRGLDNARTYLPTLTAPPIPPGPPEQWAGLSVPVLLLRGEMTRDIFRQSNEKLFQYLPAETESGVVPDAPHLWYPVNPESGAKLILDFVGRH